MKKILSALAIMISITTMAALPTPSKGELDLVGDLIYRNETGGKKDLLVHWNVGEEFPSLGIGHFIWYPENFKSGRFEESFPGLVAAYAAKGIEVPKIMSENRYAPWSTKEEFLAGKKTQEVKELTEFLANTKDVQVEYIFERSQKALEKILKETERPEHVKAQYERIAASPNGIYPLIDYVNFKGEGIKDTERYEGQGWGLLQVLEAMEGTEPGQPALNEFSKKAIEVLKRRIKNAPAERGEDRWLGGWESRCNTYSQVGTQKKK